MFPKMVGIGDSLMSGEHETSQPKWVDKYEYSWLSQICRRCGSKVTHYSKGGLTAKSWLEEYGSAFKKDKDTYPVVFIALGTNDMAQNYTPGTINDTEDTFASYYKKIIKIVRDKNPHCIIFLCSLYYDNYERNTAKFNNTIIEISQQYKLCYYIDISNRCKYNMTKTEYKSESHFNTLGYYFISFEIQNLANEQLCNNYKDIEMIGLYN